MTKYPPIKVYRAALKLKQRQLKAQKLLLAKSKSVKQNAAIKIKIKKLSVSVAYYKAKIRNINNPVNRTAPVAQIKPVVISLPSYVKKNPAVSSSTKTKPQLIPVASAIGLIAFGSWLYYNPQFFTNSSR